MAPVADRDEKHPSALLHHAAAGGWFSTGHTSRALSASRRGGNTRRHQSVGGCRCQYPRFNHPAPEGRLLQLPMNAGVEYSESLPR